MTITVFEILLLAGSLVVAQPPEESRPAKFGDFAAYWTAGRCFWQRSNNYDEQVVKRIEREEDLSQTFPIWNPPWIFPLIAPFSLLPFTAGAIAWCLMNVGLVILSANLLARHLAIKEFWAMVLGITFLPVAICVGISQLAILVLAGAVLYQAALRSDRPFLAGVSLALCSIKPHVVGLIWLLAAFTGTLRTRLRVLAGFCCSIGLLSLLTLAWHPATFPNYLGAVRNQPEISLTEYYSATLGMWLRRTPEMVPETWRDHVPSAIADRARAKDPRDRLLPIWLQFLPLAMATVGLGWFLVCRRPETCTVSSFGLTLILSSIALPYGWHYDQATLLPVYLWLWGCAVWPRGDPSSPARRSVIIAGLLLFEIGQAIMIRISGMESYFVVWPLLLALLVGIGWSRAE